MINKKLNIKSKIGTRSAASEYLKQPGDAVIVDRQGPRWLILKCPCGCGAELPVNLDPRAGPAWRLYETPKGTSVYPSVWRDTDCKSHFIIWRNNILLFGPRQDDPWVGASDVYDNDFYARVNGALSTREQSVEEISEKVPGSVPWDVLRCCRQLCRQGRAVEGFGRSMGRFRLR